MFKKIFLIANTLFLLNRSDAQVIDKSAPIGFDSLRTGIPKGNIDTITYESKTVGTKRRALIYLNYFLNNDDEDACLHETRGT